jgi:hypothetical protein
VNLQADLQRLLPIFAVVLVALGAAILVTHGLGGGSSGSAQQLLDRALEADVKSATFNARVSFSFETGQTGRGAMIVDSVQSGASSGSGTSARRRIHSVDRVIGRPTVAVDDVAVGGQGYVGVDGRWYRLSPAQYDRVFESDKSESWEQTLGFDPGRAMRNPKLEGTANVGGVESNHISGDLDADALLNELRFFGGSSPDAAEARFTRLVQASKKSGHMDVFAGKQDGILRRLAIALQMNAAEGGTPLRAKLTIALGLDKVNEPVTVEAPKSALPPDRIADIPRAKLGDQADEILGPPKSSARPPARKRPAHRGTRAKPRPSARRYVSCVQAAQDLAALVRCQPLLP